MSNQKEKTTAQAAGMNRAKPYQLVLFPMNNGATNVYYILTMNFIAYYANGVLGLALMFATTMVTVMRLFDAVTDPIIGASRMRYSRSLSSLVSTSKEDAISFSW